MRREHVDLSQLGDIVVRQLQQHYPASHVTVNIQGNMQTYADASLLAILLDNLFSNAWKYTSKVQLPSVEFACQRKQDTMVYFVRDNGAGFDMRYADKLFKPFQRLHRDDEYPGHGIGLATVARIIRLHGGEVWADSELGTGTTVAFTLEPLLS